MTTIAVEPLSSIQPGVVELMYDNWIETGCHQDRISLEPDWDAYRRAEEAGRFVAIGVRDEGTLIGYAFFFLGHPIHHKGHLAADCDVIYLRPERRGFIGACLIRDIGTILRGLGAQSITLHITSKLDWSRTAEREGYSPTETLWTKVLGD